MLNGPGDKYDNQDDTEYHFSDDEVNYDADSSQAKSAPASAPLENLSPSPQKSLKRMVMGGGVFLALVVVVYKMVSTTTVSDPGGEIVAVPKTAQKATVPAPTREVMRPAAPAIAVAKTVEAAPPKEEEKAPVETMAAAQPTSPRPVVNQVTAPSVPQAPVRLAEPDRSSQSQLASAPNSVVEPASVATPKSEEYVVPGASVADAKASQMAAENEKLMAQLQAQYTQRINDYQAQNKNLQDQVQTLNTRVASMETQMNQMLQSMMKNNNDGNAKGVDAAAPGQEAVAEPKLNYNVQAIIPGRAWLRAENGDTLTVAEGDTIKDVSRVTKIDPYDGIVEINTGTKVVALSYGTGG